MEVCVERVYKVINYYPDTINQHILNRLYMFYIPYKPLRFLFVMENIPPVRRGSFKETKLKT